MACPLCSGSHPDQCPMAPALRRRSRYAYARRPDTRDYSREAELERAEFERVRRFRDE